MAIPKGADIFYQGSFYKISCTDQVFIYVNGDWILSSRSVGEIRNAILCEKKGTSTSASTKKKSVAERTRPQFSNQTEQ